MAEVEVAAQTPKLEEEEDIDDVAPADSGEQEADSKELTEDEIPVPEDEVINFIGELSADLKRIRTQRQEMQIQLRSAKIFASKKDALCKSAVSKYENIEHVLGLCQTMYTEEKKELEDQWELEEQLHEYKRMVRVGKRTVRLPCDDEGEPSSEWGAQKEDQWGGSGGGSGGGYAADSWGDKKQESWGDKKNDSWGDKKDTWGGSKW